MKNPTQSQLEARELYILHKDVNQVAKELGIGKNVVLKSLGRCAINMGVFDADYSNPFPLPDMMPDRATTCVDFGKEGAEVKRVWYKDKINKDGLQSIIDSLANRIPVNPVDISAPDSVDRNTMLEINIADAHIGALAWKEENLDSNYNLKIAKKLYLSAVKETLERSGRVGKIRIVLLGDTTHTNGLIALTPASKHVLDVDSRFPKILDFTIDIICCVIEMCANYCHELEVFCVRGNHDEDTAICLERILKAYFRLVDNIKIDDSASKTRFATFGCSAFAMAHGDRTKLDRLAADLLMWVARNDIEGIRDFYVLQGHFHAFKVADVNGVICETMPTLMPRESFASGGNWHSKRMLRSRTFDRDKGLTTTHTVTPRQLNL